MPQRRPPLGRRRRQGPPRDPAPPRCATMQRAVCSPGGRQDWRPAASAIARLNAAFPAPSRGKSLARQLGASRAIFRSCSWKTSVSSRVPSRSTQSGGSPTVLSIALIARLVLVDLSSITRRCPIRSYHHHRFARNDACRQADHHAQARTARNSERQYRTEGTDHRRRGCNLALRVLACSFLE